MRYSRLIIIYNADGGLRGELSYVVKKLAGTASCSLCDITHTMRGKKSAWKSACSRLPVPVQALHRNEIDDDVRAAVDGELPCVVGIGDDGPRRIVDPPEIDAIGGDVVAFESLLRSRLG